MGNTPERAWKGAFSSGPLEPVSLDYSSIDNNLLPYAAVAEIGLHMLHDLPSTFTGGFWDVVFVAAERQYSHLRLGERRAPGGFNFNERDKKEQAMFLGNSRIEPMFPSTEVGDVIYNSSKQFSINAAVRGNRSGFLPTRRTP